jgi:ABC-type nickel/cobalt efflux system permease component RcnA
MCLDCASDPRPWQNLAFAKPQFSPNALVATTLCSNHSSHPSHLPPPPPPRTLQDAIKGRAKELVVTNQHYVTGNPIKPPFGPELNVAIFATGCFWGTEKVPHTHTHTHTHTHAHTHTHTHTHTRLFSACSSVDPYCHPRTYALKGFSRLTVLTYSSIDPHRHVLDPPMH